jgi:proteasome lid subunit RPN8/RPN11
MVEAIVAHARRDHPDEACGIVTGKDGVAVRMIEMDNADRSPTGFTFDSAQWLRVYREVDDADEQFLVVYHSHTMTEAYPSRTDVRGRAHRAALAARVDARPTGRSRSFRIRTACRRRRSSPSRTSGTTAGTPAVDPEDAPQRGEPPAWPSRSASRRSCARTPAARRPCRAAAAR